MEPSGVKMALKLYVRDNINVGFWMAVSGDSWKSGCVLRDDVDQTYFIKVCFKYMTFQNLKYMFN